MKHAPKLTKFRLSEVGKLCDVFTPHIAMISNLTSLELSYSTHTLSDEGVQDLLQSEAWMGSSPSLIPLSDVPLLTDQGLAELTCVGVWMELANAGKISSDLQSVKSKRYTYIKTTSFPGVSTVQFGRTTRWYMVVFPDGTVCAL